MGELAGAGGRILQHTLSIGATSLPLHIANKVPADAIEFWVVILHCAWGQHVLGDGSSQGRPILCLSTAKDTAPFSIEQFLPTIMDAALWQSLPQNIRNTRVFTRYYSLCKQHFYQWHLSYITNMCMKFLWHTLHYPLLPHYTRIFNYARWSKWRKKWPFTWESGAPLIHAW